MQAIVTKFLSPTNTLGARIKATCDAARCDARSVTIPFDHSAPYGHGPHDIAAAHLIRLLGWDRLELYGPWTRGRLPGGGYVYVAPGRTPDDATLAV
jgi:hypothetical protein